MHHPVPPLLAVYVVLLLIFTQMPFLYAGGGHLEFSLTSGQADPGLHELAMALINLVMLAPLGALLRHVRTPPLSLGLVAAGLCAASLAVEMLQALQHTRVPSAGDFLLNTAGGFAGAWLSDRVLPPLLGRLRRNPRSTAVAGTCLYALLVVVLLASQARSASLSSWDPDMPLVLKNEATGDRPWSGNLPRVLIFDYALPEDRLFGHDPDSGIAHLPAAPVIDWRDGGRERLAAQELTRSMQRSNAFTIAAWITPQTLSQQGPARIVSLSADPGSRNFTLGQVGRDLEFRLRTRTSTTNGHMVRTTAAPLSGQPQQVIIRYADGVIRMSVDGAAVLTAAVATPTLAALAQAGVPGLGSAIFILCVPLLLIAIQARASAAASAED